MLAVLVAMAVFVPVGAATSSSGVSSQSAEAYSGTHVTFDTASDAIVDYRVNGETVMESVKVQSKSQAQSGGIGVDTSLKAVTNFEAAGISLGTTTNVQATVQVESGATMQAHDNSRGILVIESGGESQYVTVNLSGDTETTEEGDKVVVTTGNGTEGVFLVVGEGQVTVNDGGNVTADLSENSRLVYRSYPQGRDSQDQKQEELITSGKAAAEVYIVQASESGEQGGEQVADVVHYSRDTTVEVTEQSKGRLVMTAQRSQSQGRVILCTVSEAAFSSVQDVQVSVDGEAAAKTSSYSELRSATEGGDQSRYLVRQQSSAEASGEVLVAIDQFSTREVAVTSGDGGGGPVPGQPGFGLLVALTAIAATLLARVRL